MLPGIRRMARGTGDFALQFRFCPEVRIVELGNPLGHQIDHERFVRVHFSIAGELCCGGSPDMSTVVWQSPHFTLPP